MSEVETPAAVPTEAGRALDALIAEKVMGWRWVTFDSEDREWLSSGTVGRERPSHPQQRWGDGTKRRDLETVPRFSTDISAAWLVVSEMNRRMAEHGSRPAGDVPLPWPDANYSTLICRGGFAVKHMGGFAASFCCVDDYEAFIENPEAQGGALADTAPHAIALAALSALEAP